jgi:hypothetical protein
MLSYISGSSGLLIQALLSARGCKGNCIFLIVPHVQTQNKTSLQFPRNFVVIIGFIALDGSPFSRYFFLNYCFKPIRWQ